MIRFQKMKAGIELPEDDAAAHPPGGGPAASAGTHHDDLAHVEEMDEVFFEGVPACECPKKVLAQWRIWFLLRPLF